MCCGVFSVVCILISPLKYKLLKTLYLYSTAKLRLVITSFGAAYSHEPASISIKGGYERAITWDVTVDFNEPGGAYDYSVFGEAPDANDGPPADAYDTVKPPAPMPSYIRAWFNDNLPFPYNTLWKDYRHYPDDAKTWNLTIQWVPQDGESPSTITISWNPTDVSDSEYTMVNLCTSAGVILKNMLIETTYSFTATAYLPQTFKIICLTNQQPNPPSNPSPANNSITVLVNTDLGWTCSDPDGDPLTYDVYFGLTNPPAKVASNITSPVYDPGTMEPGTIYFWKIVAWDPYDFSRSGPVWNFRTNYLPNQPSNPNPANASTGVSINADLSWTGGDLDPGDSVTYTVYFGTSSTPPKVADNISQTTYLLGTLAYNTLYYWRIVAWDNHNTYQIGPLWHFTTQPNQPPYPPSNPSPANGAVDVSITADLSWTGGDPDGDTVTYTVFFGTSSSPPPVAQNISLTTYDPGTLTYYTLYYWRIVAYDSQGASTTGPLWHFTTGELPNEPPYPPSNPIPANGSTGISIDTDLDWDCSDPDGHTLTYDVYFGPTNPPPKVASNISTSDFSPGTLEYFTYYYWRIIAWDDHDHQTSGPLWRFRTMNKVNHPPNAPSNPFPSDGATEIPINVELCWTGGDPDGDFVTYDVYFGVSFPLPKVKSNISSPCHTVGNLDYGTKYYWKIVAWDYQTSNSSEVWSFTTKRDVTKPSLAIISPKEGYLQVNLGNTIVFKFPIFIRTILVGQIDVTATATDTQSGMDRVEIWIDQERKANLTAPPYSWTWEERGFGFSYQITVKAYDNAGNENIQYMKVKKWL